MINHSYLDLLVVNYFQSKVLLKDYIIEKCKHVNSKIVFQECYSVIDLLIHHIDLNIKIQIANLEAIKNHSKDKKRIKEIDAEIKLIEKDDRGKSSNYPYQERSLNLNEIKGCRHSGIIKYSQILEIKEAIDQAKVEVGEQEPNEDKSKIKWTVSIFALYLYFLKKGGYKNEITKKYLPELCKEFHYGKGINNLNNTIIEINKESEKDPINKSNLLIVISLLEEYPKSQSHAIKALDNYQPKPVS